MANGIIKPPQYNNRIRQSVVSRSAIKKEKSETFYYNLGNLFNT